MAALFGVERAQALPVYEPFADVTAFGGTSYTVTSNLWAQTNYPTGRWQGVGTSGFSGVMPVIASGNLSYAGLLASTGNSVSVQPSSGGGARLNLTNNFGGGNPTSIYYSFLLKVTDLSAVPTYATNNPIVALCDDPREQTAQVARLGARLVSKKSGAGYVLGLGRNNTLTDYAYESTVHNVGDTVFVVACNELVAGVTNVNLWVNPSSATFGAGSPPTPSAQAVLYSSTTGGINSSGPQAFAIICQFPSEPSAVIDDVRVGKTWAEATGSPVIALAATNQTLNAGSTASFSVLAFGGATNFYQWQKDGSDLSNGGKISGATSATLTISNVLTADVGNYTLVISNAYGITTSPAAALAVTDPAIITQPVNQTIMPNGSNTTLHVVAAGTPTLTYQWYKDGSPLSNGGHISGATTANLTVSSFSSATDAGTYYVIVQNGLSASVTSSNSLLLATDPSITSQPQSRTNAYGTSATFQVVVSGTPPISYQWQKVGTGNLSDGGNISGAHTNLLTINPVSLSDAGTYFVTITNALGSVDSIQAVLTVLDPAILSGPDSTNITAGSTAVFHCVVVGSPSLTYQWYKNNTTVIFDGGNISGAGTDTLTINNVSATDQASYSLQIFGATTIQSSNATLTIIQPFALTVQPTSRKVPPGATTALAVGATGQSLQYQWQIGTTDIPGATSAAYIITNVQVGSVGTYRVIISSGGNFLTSSPASVSLVSPLKFAESNLVAIRVGDGAQTLSANGNSMFLDQFGLDGTYLSTLGIPNSGTYGMIGIGPNIVTVGANTSITGNSLSRSADGLHLSFAGYATNLTYNAPLQNSASTAVPRGIGLIDAQGHYALAISTSNGFPTAIWRGAVTDGTNNYYGHARTVGTFYFGYDATNAVIQNQWVNTRSMAIFNNGIYMVGAVNGNNGVMLLSNLPTAPVTPTILFPGSTGSSDCEVSPDGNTIYLADDGGSGGGAGVQKWHFDGSTWSQLYILNSGVGARYVAADFSGVNPVIFAVTTEDGNNTIVRIVDTGAGATGTFVANAGVNQNFRGIRFGPRAATLARPTIAYSKDSNNNLLLNWPGPFYLQSASTVVGPYQDVVNGTRVFTNALSAPNQGYFRLRQ